MNASEKLTALRAVMAAGDLAGYLVPRGDEHLGEYVPPSAERLGWLTGFTGSAGIACVLQDEATLWSDGRYILQMAAQTDAAVWQRLHVTHEPPAPWIAARIGAGVLGYDPWLFSEEGLRPFRDAGISLRAVSPNLIDQVWADRPAPPAGPALPHAEKYAGASSAEKRERIAGLLRDKGEDAAVITDPASLAWLLNIRGTDVDCTPFALGFCLLHADGRVDLFMDGGKLPAGTREFLGNHVAVAERAALPGALAGLGGKRVRVDSVNSPVWFADQLRAAGAHVAAGQDPCLVPKACKNAVEQQGFRDAHVRDAVAMARFLHWAPTAAGSTTEMEAAAHLHGLRAEGALFRGDSFPAISGAGENGAIMHYRVTAESNRKINRNEVYLIDSGGQYADGTTDITRTLWTGPDAPPDEVKDRFTRVLKGHIAIATLVFPDGTPGVRLDSFARHALWQVGLDFDHGTGHGVGSYLSVHEGPASISPYLRPAGLAEGMVMSNEPGFYWPGHYGIRLENLVIAQRSPVSAEKAFLQFETITWAPFDRTLINTALLTPSELAWLNGYHANVLAKIGPLCPPDTAAWLAQACAPLEHAA